MVYTPFFDRFPKVKYDINQSKVNPKYEELTDIFVRIGYLKDILQNSASYYIYIVEDGDTPEILAEKVYEDPGAAWMIIYANKILDPQFDWPLDYNSFNNYIIDKYGSIANAKVGIHHYEKVITRTVDTGPDEIVTETRFVVNKKILTDGVLTLANTNGTFTIGEDVFYGDVYTVYANAAFKGQVSDWDATNNVITIANTQGELVLYNTIRGNTSLANGQIVATAFDGENIPYDYYDNLPETQSVETYNVGDRAITEVIKRDAISYYDYENQLNEDRKKIKVIKNNYYAKVQGEFKQLVSFREPYIRRLV